MTLHISDTHLSFWQICPLVIKADFPCRKPLLYGLFFFTLWCRGKPTWCRFAHSSSIIIFLPVLWGETLLSLQFTFLYVCTRLSAISHHRQLSVLSIFHSAARSHSVSAGCKAPEKARTSPLEKSSLKIKAFLQWSQHWRLLNATQRSRRMHR